MPLYNENSGNECWHQVNAGEECSYCQQINTFSESKTGKLERRLAELKEERRQAEEAFWQEWQRITATT